MKTLELIPVNSRKSFYGKCKVEESSNQLLLKSYNTLVAIYDKDTDTLKVTDNENHLTNTTLNHIRSFIDFIGKNSNITKKQIIAEYSQTI